MNAKPCPHCGQWALKDDACSYIFACGLSTDGKFYSGIGCGRPWCWECGKRYCSQYIDVSTGAVISPRTSHDDKCCREEAERLGIDYSEYCQGPNHAHCSR